MKILQVVPYFYPSSYGGPGKIVYDISRYLAKKENNVSIYTSDCYSKDQRMPEAKKIQEKFLTVYYFKNISNTLAYRWHIFFPFSIFFRSFFDIPHVDIIHIHDFYTIPNIWIVILSLIFKKPYVLSPHGCLSEKRLEEKFFLKKVFLIVFGNLLLKSAKFLILADDEEYIYKTYGIKDERIIKISNGVDKKEFEIKTSKVKAREKLFFPKNKIIITFIGRLDKIKGLNLLIEAINILKKDSSLREKIHFIIAGPDHGYKNTLKNLIKKFDLTDIVTLSDACYGEEKKMFLKASDIFVYPSYSEGFSLGIVEAITVGLPVVITTGCNFSEVQKQKAGIVVSPIKTDIAKGLHSLIVSLSKRKKYGKNASLLAEKEFSLNKILLKQLEAYKRACSN